MSFDAFATVEIKLGTIEAVSIVEGADRLLQLTVDLGEAEPRQIVSGIREFFPDEQVLIGRQCPFIANLAPRKIKGLVRFFATLAFIALSIILQAKNQTKKKKNRFHAEIYTNKLDLIY